MLSNIVLNNGTANVTFVVTQLQAGIGELESRVDGRPDLGHTLSLSNAKAAAGRRFKMKLVVPVTSTDAGGLISRVESVIANIDIRLPNNSKTSDRTVMRNLIKNALLDAQVLALIDTAIGVS